MIPEPASPSRARGTIVGLLAGIGAVLLIQLVVGLPILVFYGLVGGLIMSLIVVGLDLLHGAERTMGRDRRAAPPDEPQD